MVSNWPEPFIRVAKIFTNPIAAYRSGPAPRLFWWRMGGIGQELPLRLPAIPAIIQIFAIIKYAVSTAISSPDYSNKSANKNPITSRSDSGSDRATFEQIFIKGG